MVHYRKDILALVALGAVFAAAVVYARRVYAPCDDTYIYLVYAKNFLAGNGLTYNGIKIQGFTSTLWMLILLLGGVFPARLPVVAETLSAVSGLFVMVGAYWVSRRFGLSQIHALVVPVLLAGTWDFVFYMGNGMETVFLEQSEKLQLQRRANSCGIGFEPGAGIVDVAGFQWARRWGFLAQLVQRGDYLRPSKLIVESLVLVRLEAAVTGCFAISVVEMLKGSIGNMVECFGDAVQVAATAEAGINEG